jgi:hypothetical protein
MIKIITPCWCFLAAMFVLTGNGQAATTFYSDRGSFSTAAGSLSGFESFEGSYFSGSTVDFGSFTVSETGDQSNFVDQISFSNTTDGVHSLKMGSGIELVHLHYENGVKNGVRHRIGASSLSSATFSERLACSPA